MLSQVSGFWAVARLMDLLVLMVMAPLLALLASGGDASVIGWHTLGDAAWGYWLFLISAYFVFISYGWALLYHWRWRVPGRPSPTTYASGHALTWTVAHVGFFGLEAGTLLDPASAAFLLTLHLPATTLGAWRHARRDQ